MENIVVFPEDKNQLSVIKEFLSRMKIKFKTQENSDEIILSDEEKKLIDKGLKNIKDHKVKSKESAHEIFQKCFK